jgi:hypothetical protein
MKSDIRRENEGTGQDEGSNGPGIEPVETARGPRAGRPKSKAWYIRKALQTTSDTPAVIAEVYGSDVSHVYRIRRQLRGDSQRDGVQAQLDQMKADIRAVQDAIAWLVAAESLRAGGIRPIGKRAV